MTFDRRTRATLIIAGVVLAGVVLAGLGIAEVWESGFYHAQGNIHHNATDGPEVIQSKDYELASGNPFTDHSYKLNTSANGEINVSAQPGDDTTTMQVQVDEINGTWTNTSNIQTDSGSNITLQPGDKNFTRVGGSITLFKYRDPKVNDSTEDAIYSGSGTLVFETNASDGHQYGLIDTSTGKALDIVTADSDGTVAFTSVPSGTTREVRIDSLGTLIIRHETEPHDKITESTVRAKFFETGDDDTPTIANRTTSDGEIDLTGLPVDETFVVEMSASGFFNRTVLIKDLGSQSTIFLLNTSNEGDNVTFAVEDPTGQFTSEDTEIEIERAINQSLYDTGGFAWLTVEGDRIGATGEIATTLEHEERYRLRVSNADDTRVLGGYQPTGDASETLRPSPPDVNVTDEEGYAWNGSVNDTAAGKVVFEFNDPDDNTTDLRVRIYEQNNESNEILDSTNAGPHGFLKVTQPLSGDQVNRSWVIDWNATRQGETIGSERVVGRKVVEQVPGLATVWQNAFAVATVILVGALFSVANVGAGAIATIFVGGGFWMAGWLPDSAGGALMLLLVIGVLWKARSEGFV